MKGSDWNINYQDLVKQLSNLLFVCLVFRKYRTLSNLSGAGGVPFYDYLKVFDFFLLIFPPTHLCLER